MRVTMMVSEMHAGGACRMAAACGGSGRRSREDMGKEEGDLLRTVERLRGRLQAERVASRAAKEESDLMAKRVAELERLMAVEIRARNRAEKRFRCALKKLQSLESLDASGVSGVSGNTAGDSSSASTSDLRMTGKGEPGYKGEDSGQCGGGGSVYFSADSARQSVSQDASWSSAGSAGSVNNDDRRPDEEVDAKKSPTDGEPTDGDFNRGKSPSSFKEKDQSIHKVDKVDDPLASVPESSRPDTQKKHGPVDNQRRMEKAEAEAESGKWQVDNDPNDVLFLLRLVEGHYKTQSAQDLSFTVP